MRSITLSIFSFFILLLSACAVRPKPSDKHLVVEKNEEVERGILFLNMNFKAEQDDYNVEASSGLLVDGKLKKGLNHHGEVAVILVGPRGSDTVFVENPLSTHFEEFSENGEIKRIEVQMEEAEIFVRINYSPDYTKLIVRDMEQEKNKFVCGIR